MTHRTSFVMAAALAATLAMSHGRAEAAGFNCRYAHSTVEKLICANPKLSRLDDELAKMYESIEGETRGFDAETGERLDPFGAEQFRWRRTVRDKCTNAACLERVYVTRIRQVRKNWADALGVN
jgi:uncharacterized protein